MHAGNLESTREAYNVRVAKGAAEGNFSFLSALTANFASQVHALFS